MGGVVPAGGCTCPRGYLPGGCTCPGGCTYSGGYLPRGSTCPGTPPCEENGRQVQKYYLAQTSFAGSNNRLAPLPLGLAPHLGNPGIIFFKGELEQVAVQDSIWVIVFWWISMLFITRHIWFPRAEKLASLQK